MNVLFRFLKVLGIALLMVLNENKEKVFGELSIPTHFIGSLIGFLLFFLVAELCRDVLRYFYRKRKKMGLTSTDNVIVGIDNTYFLILTGALLYFLLHLLKLKPKDFFTGLTLISAALAIIMKDYVSNIISGMIMAFSDKLKIGHYVQIGKHTGEIIDLSLTMISLRNDDNEIVYIPTNLIYSQDIINHSTMEQDDNTVTFEVNHKMKLPFEEIEGYIHTALQPYATLFSGETGELLIHSSNQETTTFKYHYTLKKIDLQTSKKIRHTILKAIYHVTPIIKSPEITKPL